MTKKNTSRTLKKVMTGFVVFNVFASSFLTALPTISSATESSEGQVSRPNLRASTTNLLKNPSFNLSGGTIQDWDFVYSNAYLLAGAPVNAYTPFAGSDGWFYNQSYSPFIGVSVTGNSTAQFMAKVTNNNSMSYLKQTVNTVSGGLYTVKYNSSVTSFSNTGDTQPWVGSAARNKNESVDLGNYYSNGGGLRTYDFIAAGTQTDILFGGGVDSKQSPREAITNIGSVSVVDNSTTINSLTSASTVVTGTAYPGQVVIISNGTTELGRVTANSTTGAYSLNIAPQAKGTVVTALVSKGGKTSRANTTVANDRIAQTTINEIYSDDTQVSGTAEAGSHVVVRNSSNTVIAEGTVSANGTYRFNITPQNVNDTITATATEDGQTSSANTVVKGNPAPQVNPVSDTHTQVTGQGQAGFNITVSINGITYTGVANGNGAYSVTIPRQQVGTKISVTQTNPNNNKISPIREVTVTGSTLAKPVIEPVSVGDTSVVVTGIPGAAINFTDQNGDVSTKTANASGRATFYVDPARVNDVFSATQTGDNDVASERATYTVRDTTTPNAPLVNPVSDVQTQVTGTGAANHTIRVTINGITYTGTANGSGAYSVTIPRQTSGTRIEVTQTNPNNGNVSPKGAVAVYDTTLGAPKISAINVGATQVTVTGAPNASIKLKLPSGSEATATANSQGVAVFNVPAAQVGQVYEATQTGGNGKASVKDTFTVVDTTTPNAPLVNPVSDVQTQVNGTALPNYRVTVTINGVTYTGTASGSGAYTVLIPKQTSGTRIEVTQTNPNNGNVSPKQSVIVSDTTLGAPKISNIKVGDTQVTVTGTAGARITLTLPGGSKPSVTADGTGKAIFSVPAAQVGQVYEATQTGGNGKASAKDTFTVSDTTTPLAPRVNPVSDVQTQVTGTADPNYRVTVTINGATYTGTASGSGAYTVLIPKQTSGTRIEVTQTNPNNGNVSPKETVTVSDTTLGAPIISNIKVGDTQVTVTGTAGARITLTLPGGSKPSMTADGTGKAIFSVPAAQVGQVYEATQTGENGKASVKDTFTVSDTTTPLAPRVNPVSDVQTQVTGTADPNYRVTVTINGATYTGTASGSGAYTVLIPKQTSGTRIEVTQTNPNNGNVSPKETVTVSDTTLGAPIISNIKVGDTQVTVTGTAGARITLTLPGGSKPSMTADGTGKAIFSVPAAQVGNVFEATQTGENGKASAKDTFTVSDTTIPLAPRVNPVSDVQTQVTGTADPNYSITVTINGATYTGTASGSGAYTILIPKQTSGTRIEVTQTNPNNGNVSPKQSVTVSDTTLGAPIISNIKVGDTQVTVTGTAGARITLTLPGGSKPSMTADGTGKAIFSVPAAQIGNVFEATQTGENGKASAKDTFTVIDTTTPLAPSVNPVSDVQTQVTGTGAANHNITVAINGVTYTGTASGSGAYSVTIPKQTSGTKIEVTQTNPNNGNVSPKQSVTVSDTTLGAPSISEITEDNTQVTVTGQPNTSITLVLPTGSKMSLVSDATGKAIFTIPAAQENTTYQAYQTGANGKASPSASASVKSLPKSGTITANEFTIGVDISVTGTYTGDVKSVRLIYDGVEYRGGSVGSGSYSFYALSTIKDKTKTAKMYGYDKNGVKIAETVLSLRDTKDSGGIGTGSITATEFMINRDINITGTVTGDVVAVGLVYDGTEYRGGTVSNGNYSFYALSTVTDKTKTATMYGYDRNGNRIATAVVTLRDAKDPGGAGTGSITANDFTIHRDLNVTGTYTGDVVSLGLVYDGKEYRGGTVSNGTFSFYALNTIKDKTKTATMYGYDRNGNRIATTPIVLRDAKDPGRIGTGEIKTNEFTIHRDSNVTGTYTGDVVSLGLVYDGTEYRGGSLSNGTFSFYALNTIKDKTKTATMYGSDQNGNRIATDVISLRDAKDETISGTGTVTADNFVIGTSTRITGTFTGDVHSLIVKVGTTEYAGGTLDKATGTYSFYAWGKINSVSDDVTVYGINKQGARIATTPVVVTKPNTSGTITPNEFVIGQDSNLTATYTGDVKRVVVTINGVEHTGGTVSNGNVTFFIGNKIVSKNDTVNITAYDAYNQKLQEKIVTLKDISDNTSGTITPNLFLAGQDSDITATYTGDVKSIKVTINNQVYIGGTLSNGNASFWIGDKITSSGDEVFISAYDLNGKKLDEKPVEIKNINGDIHPDEYTVRKDTVLTANVTNAVRSVKVVINGVDYVGGTISGGRLSFWIGDKIKDSKDTVRIYAYDKNGRELDNKAVVLKDLTPEVGTLTPSVFSLKTSSVRGAYTGEGRSLRLTVNGTALQQGGTVSGGTFSYYVGLRDKIRSKTDVVQIELLDRYGLVMDTKNLTIID